MLKGLTSPHRRTPTKLRPYQAQAKEAILAEWKEGRRKTICCLPTGAGKTLLAGSIIADYAGQGIKTLFLAHTRKLVKQAARAIEDDYGVPSTLEMGGHVSDGSPLCCATIQTIARKLPPKDEYGLIVTDECHRIRTEGYAKILKHFDQANVLGITATPRRTDQKNLLSENGFDSKAFDIPLSQLIDEGYLAPITILNIPIQIELRKEGAGDYSEEEVAHAIEPYLESCADAFVENAKGRASLVFLPLISTSKRFTEMLCQRGVSTAHVDGEMRERDVEQILNMLELGKVQAVCSSMLLTEGVDIRPVNCILNLRPTRAWGLYCQIVGRGTRLFDPAINGPSGTVWPKKEECLLLDPLWLCDDHSLLQRPSCLVAKTEQEAEDIDRHLKKSGGKSSLMKAVAGAKTEHEDRLRRRLEEMRARKARVINPMEYFISVGDTDGANYTPLARWEEAAPSPAQLALLLRNGFDMEEIKSKGQASALISSLTQRIDKGLATTKQARYCGTLGHPDPWNLSFEEASQWIESHIPKWRRR